MRRVFSRSLEVMCWVFDVSFVRRVEGKLLLREVVVCEEIMSADPDITIIS